MERIILWTSRVEKILIRHFANPLLWIVLLTGIFIEYRLSTVGNSPKITEGVLLARYSIVIEIVLVLSCLTFFAWEAFKRASLSYGYKASEYKSCRLNEESILQTWLASVLILFLVALCLILTMSILNFQYIVTILQRTFFLLLTVVCIPTVYLLLKQKDKNGFWSIMAISGSIIFYLALSILITWLSSRGDENAFFARLNDVYFWNNKFPNLARSELWLTIYMPWFLWYLVMYLFLDFLLFVLLVLKERLNFRRD